MADFHFTGSVCPTETPTPSFDDALRAYTPRHESLFWVREPDPPGYQVPAAITKLLARNVRLERIMRGWTQETLAELADLNRTYIGAIERCECSPTLPTVEKLANAFDLTVVELLSPGRFNA